MPSAATNLASAAERYAKQGWPIFPLMPRAKGPATPNGFKDATADVVTVTQWWTATPDANIGFVPASSGFLVIDIDGPDGERAAQPLGLLTEPTLTVTTARGRHLWFKHPGGIIGNTPLAPHVDVRGNLGYVLLPPSVHPDGSVYRWAGKVEEVRMLPPDVLTRLAGKARPYARGPLPEKIPSGQRNIMLASLAGSMRRRGASEQAITAALEVENTLRCDPPLDSDELAAIAGSIATYSPATPEGIDPALRDRWRRALERLAEERERDHA